MLECAALSSDPLPNETETHAVAKHVTITRTTDNRAGRTAGVASYVTYHYVTVLEGHRLSSLQICIDIFPHWW